MNAQIDSNILELSVVLAKDGPPLEEKPDLEPIISPQKRHQLFDQEEVADCISLGSNTSALLLSRVEEAHANSMQQQSALF